MNDDDGYEVEAKQFAEALQIIDYLTSKGIKTLEQVKQLIERL